MLSIYLITLFQFILCSCFGIRNFYQNNNNLKLVLCTQRRTWLIFHSSDLYHRTLPFLRSLHSMHCDYLSVPFLWKISLVLYTAWKSYLCFQYSCVHKNKYLVLDSYDFGRLSELLLFFKTAFRSPRRSSVVTYLSHPTSIAPHQNLILAPH